ncbi:MAG: DUF554 domain-containing protein [Firmicutes bacterium]|jgi:uncharacterized membrane protein YqgA involved in biofilm formation|nr:DUF554 domain-containing protein [Bacillota bacterium]
MTGTLINVGTIITGTFIGMVVKARMPERITQTTMDGIGLFTIFVGLSMLLESQNMLIVLFSIVLGTITGSLLDINGRLERAANNLESRFAKDRSGLAQGFLAASLLFCVGPMAILGSIENGLTGSYPILMTKALMDGFSSVIFGATMGIGVALSALPLLLYQGALTLGASVVKEALTDLAMTEMTATGGLLIVGIGINMLGIKKISVADMLPAIAIAVLLAHLFP